MQELEKMKADTRAHGRDFRGPQVVITDRQMRTDPANPKSPKENDAGWEFAKFIGSTYPRTYILLESSQWWPIKARVSGAQDKADGLFLESVLDLLDEDYLNRSSGRTTGRFKPILGGGSSLGQGKVIPAAVDRREIVRMIDKNISENPKPLYLLIPSSEIAQIQKGAFERVLKNPKIQIEILWDSQTMTGVSERMDFLKEMGLEVLLSQKNFKANIANGKTAGLSLADQVSARSHSLIEKGISAKQIGFLKPESSSEIFSGVLSLKSVKSYSLFLMLYLIQIEGSREADLLRVFQVDPKTGDYLAILDQELEALFAAQFAAKLTAKAA
jgi:hypothetical protein